MKPMKVIAGEHAPDVDELLEKAKGMDDMLTKVANLRDDSQIRNITGVEQAPMAHYWTNQESVEEGIESVTNRGALSETVSFDTNANPHQTGSTLSVHENSGGELKKAGLEDLLAGAGGGPKPPGGPPGPPGMGKPPMDDMDDMGDDDADALSDRIKSLVDKLASKAGGPDKMPLPPDKGPAGPPGGPPGPPGGMPGGMPKPPGGPPGGM